MSEISDSIRRLHIEHGMCRKVLDTHLERRECARLVEVLKYYLYSKYWWLVQDVRSKRVRGTVRRHAGGWRLAASAVPSVREAPVSWTRGALCCVGAELSRTGRPLVLGFGPR